MNVYQNEFMVGSVMNSFWHYCLLLNQASNNYFVKCLILKYHVFHVPMKKIINQKLPIKNK